MATLLILVIFCGFIGLGIPDSLFGAAWPAIYSDFNIPFSHANFITVLISLCSVISSMLSGRINARFSTVSIAIVSTMLTAVGLLGFSFSQNLLFLCLFAIPLGLGAGSIDVALNNYVAMHYSATAMSFLHCSYGVGVTVSPFLMSFAISGAGGWRGGYQIAFAIQFGIILILILSIPLWKRVRHPSNADVPPQAAQKVLSLSDTLKLPGARSVMLLFFISCGIEFTCGTWGSTFLVEAKHMPAEFAARMVTFYYAGITLGRFFSGILASRLTEWAIIRIGEACITAAVAVLLFTASPYLAAAALFLIGLGNGPIFPNLMHLTPQNFGEDVSASVMGLQSSFANTGIMLTPPIFGFLARQFGLSSMPYYLLAFLIPMLIFTQSAQKKCKRV